MSHKIEMREIDKKMEELGFNLKSIGHDNGSEIHNYLHRSNATAIHLEFGDPGAVFGLEQDICPICKDWALYHDDGRIQCPHCGYEGVEK